MFSLTACCVGAQDISFVKSMTAPPSGIRLVCEALCVLKGIKPQRIVDPSGTGNRRLPV